MMLLQTAVNLLERRYRWLLRTAQPDTFAHDEMVAIRRVMLFVASGGPNEVDLENEHRWRREIVKFTDARKRRAKKERQALFTNGEGI